jgi:hypothetical protein
LLFPIAPRDFEVLERGCIRAADIRASILAAAKP